MSIPKPPRPVKLVVSILCGEEGFDKAAITHLAERFDSPDFVSEALPFDFTDYYAAEIGATLFRRMISFKNLISPDDLPDIKLLSNDIESRLARPDGTRRVNIDPGYISLWHLVLATCKPFAHRPYLRKGVYADLTLIYRRGSFTPLEWTFPDYRSDMMIALLNGLRDRYYRQLQEAQNQEAEIVPGASRS